MTNPSNPTENTSAATQAVPVPDWVTRYCSQWSGADKVEAGEVLEWLLQNVPAPVVPPVALPALTLHGFERDDLMCIADSLESGYEKTVNVGNVTGEGDEHIESTTAAAAQFIRAILAASAAPPTLPVLTEIQAQDMDAIEKWIAEHSGDAAFFPADANHLANVTLLLIREVRAARALPDLTDEQVKERAAKAGLRWLDPIPNEDGSEGYPGGFDMSSLDEIRALIAAPAAPPALTDEWQIVPKEPTREMLKAVTEVVPQGPYDFAVMATWRAMLAAAPVLAASAATTPKQIEPTDAMVTAFHDAISGGDTQCDFQNEIKRGLRAVLNMRKGQPNAGAEQAEE